MTYNTARANRGSSAAKTGFLFEQQFVALCLQHPQVLQLLGLQPPNTTFESALWVPPQKATSTTTFTVQPSKKSDFTHAKADVQLHFKTFDSQLVRINLSLKACRKNGLNFNQVEKRKVAFFAELFAMPLRCKWALQVCTGERACPKSLHIKKSRPVLMDLPAPWRQAVLSFFQTNQQLVHQTVFAGQGPLAASHLCVIEYTSLENFTVACLPIAEIVQPCSGYPVHFGPKGSTVKLYALSIQRKGGTPDPTSLQFKCNPVALAGTPTLQVTLKDGIFSIVEIS